MAGKSRNEATREMWEDLDSGRCYILENGEQIPCDTQGQPTKHFRGYCTGFLGYKQRVQKSEVDKAKHLVPSCPTSLSNLGVNSLYLPSPSKLNGYAQFPRPSSGAQCNLQMKDKTKPHSSLLMQLHFHSPYNTTTLIEPKDPTRTCSYFTTTQPAASLKKLANTSMNRPSESTGIHTRGREGGSLVSGSNSKLLVQGQAPKSPTMSEPNETLRESQMQPKYKLKVKQTTEVMSSLQPCFRQQQNLKRISESTRNLLAKPGDIFNLGTVGCKGRTFRDVQDQQAREARELEGYRPPSEKAQRIVARGVYQVAVPTWEELFTRGVERRRQLNPKAYAEELKRDATDRKLLEKRRQQRVLKIHALETAIRTQEQVLRKEIEATNNRLRTGLPSPLPQPTTQLHIILEAKATSNQITNVKAGD